MPVAAAVGGAAVSVGISLDEDDVTAVPVSVLQKKSTKRSDLFHFRDMRGMSFHPAATKTPLVKLLTDNLVNVDVGQCGRARRRCVLLHGERERHPRLLLFQIPLGIPSKMEAPGEDELASLAGLSPGTDGMSSVAGAPNAVLSTEVEHLVESLSARSATAAVASPTGVQTRREPGAAAAAGAAGGRRGGGPGGGGGRVGGGGRLGLVLWIGLGLVLSEGIGLGLGVLCVILILTLTLTGVASVGVRRALGRTQDSVKTLLSRSNDG